MFRSEEDLGIGPKNYMRISNSKNYLGEVVYSNIGDAVNKLETRLKDLPQLRG